LTPVSPVPGRAVQPDVASAALPVSVIFPPAAASPSTRHIRPALGLGLAARPIVSQFVRCGRLVGNTTTTASADGHHPLAERNARHAAAAKPRRGPGHRSGGGPGTLTSALLLVPALDPRPLQQLAVLLLRHPLAALLDDRAHQASIFLGTTADGHAITLT